MRGVREMRNTPSLLSIPGSLCPEVVALGTVQSIGQLENFEV